MSGVFGVYSPSPVEAADLTYLGLYALQHRGQESARGSPCSTAPPCGFTRGRALSPGCLTRLP